MPLSTELQQAVVWLGQPASESNFVTDGMLRQLASQGVVDYAPLSGAISFTPFGAQVYTELVGSRPKRNIERLPTSSS